MRCQLCGKEISEGSSFCPECNQKRQEHLKAKENVKNETETNTSQIARPNNIINTDAFADGKLTNSNVVKTSLSDNDEKPQQEKVKTEISNFEIKGSVKPDFAYKKEVNLIYEDKDKVKANFGDEKTSKRFKDEMVDAWIKLVILNAICVFGMSLIVGLVAASKPPESSILIFTIFLYILLTVFLVKKAVSYLKKIIDTYFASYNKSAIWKYIICLTVICVFLFRFDFHVVIGIEMVFVASIVLNIERITGCDKLDNTEKKTNPNLYCIAFFAFLLVVRIIISFFM